MIKVMSFNIRMGPAQDGENSWPYRKSLLVERIRAFDPHLLGLQECHAAIQAGYLQEQLPDYRFVGVRRGGEGQPGEEISAILYKPAVFEQIEIRHLWLSETPDVPGSCSWDSDFPRTVERVTLRYRGRRPGEARPLVYFNTHFDYKPVAVLESARLLRSWLEALDGVLPVVVTGDFNAPAGGPAYQLLLAGDSSQAGEGAARLFRDAHRSLPGGEQASSGGTYHGYGRVTAREPIDWVLVSPHFRVLEAGVDRYHRGPLYPSDHYPVWARLALPGEA
jgi:endonuclease/exonuclease/phosphatase family metal-dependent hydrolase